ncbi:MAG TPA: hypothetical protein VHF67_06800 [Gaiellaceae bacterium]|nr:hypothetical protein [Gaiellaceae bacterium]
MTCEVPGTRVLLVFWSKATGGVMCERGSCEKLSTPDEGFSASRSKVGAFERNCPARREPPLKRFDPSRS